MKISTINYEAAFLVGLTLALSGNYISHAQSIPEPTVIAQRAIPDSPKFKGDRPPSIAKAGILNSARDHYFDVLVNGEALNRLQVNCVTFHELTDVKVVDPANGATIPHQVNYGFEEFTVTFEEPLAVGKEVRIVIVGSTVSGVTTGIIVPYRVFGESDTLGTIPLGTALVRGAKEN